VVVSLTGVIVAIDLLDTFSNCMPMETIQWKRG